MKKHLVLYLSFLILLVGGSFVVFNQYGVKKYYDQKAEVSRLKDEIKSKNVENKKLQSEIDSLKNKVPSKIEQVAREKYKLHKANEKVFEIQYQE